MGKHQHSKDKLYIVASEYARDWGGYKKRKKALPFRALPFSCCGLSLLPFEKAVCTQEGIVFDARNIIPYIKTYHRNPANGKSLTVGDLIPLKFHSNSEGAYHCPVTYKVFNDHSHIVANRKSGNVYLHEAIDMLCRKQKCWKDLITGEPFTSSDIITIQNPHEVHLRCIEEFDYVKRGIEPVLEFTGVDAEEGANVATIKPTEMMGRILQKTRAADGEIQKRHARILGSAASSSSATSASPSERKNDDKGTQDASAKARPKHPLYTTHKAAAGFTSTVIDVRSGPAVHEFREMTELEMRQELYKEIKKKALKGYVRLTTSIGNLNIQLHADLAPMACDNFIRHCESGYYDNTIFHRSIANFMIQGGDPTGTGRGGESAFEGGVPFNDEFHVKLTHTGMGVVSMANSGKNTNKSQFFITFKSCEHLNNKHSVFGKVVGGVDVLKAMEKLETKPDTDRPKRPPSIRSVVVFKNPFRVVEEEAAAAEEVKRKEEERQEATKDLPWFSTSGHSEALELPKSDAQGVGKYLKPNSSGTAAVKDADRKRNNTKLETAPSLAADRL